MMAKIPWFYEHIFAFGHLALCSLWNKYILYSPTHCFRHKFVVASLDSLDLIGSYWSAINQSIIRQ